MGYMGFKAVQAGAVKGGASPKEGAAIAAAAGRKKYGTKRMAEMAAEGRKRAKAGRK